MALTPSDPAVQIETIMDTPTAVKKRGSPAATGTNCWLSFDIVEVEHNCFYLRFHCIAQVSNFIV